MFRVITKVSPADLVTMANAVCAIIALTFFIRSVQEPFTQEDVNRISIGCCLLLVSMVLDGLDGMVARKFGSNHSYGKHLDSVADMISFSITPGILIYCTYYDKGMNNSAWLILIVAMLLAVVFGMWRLVVFIKEGHKYRNFIGLPTPSNCLFIVCTCALYANYRVGNLDGIAVLEPVTWALTNPPQGLVLMGLVSMLMMSTFMFLKVRRESQIVSGLVILGLFIALILTTRGITLNFLFHMNALVFVYGYVIINIILDVSDRSNLGWLKRSRQRRQEKRLERDEKKRLKQDMARLRREKKELQEQTRALRRMRDRLLGRIRVGEGDDEYTQVPSKPRRKRKEGENE